MLRVEQTIQNNRLPEGRSIEERPLPTGYALRIADDAGRELPVA